jgi:hypothetical protein
MIHSCNIYCHVLDNSDEMSDFYEGKETKGKWMPFAFHMDVVIACKLTSDEENQDTHNCTTVFTDHNDTYILDTPYKEFLRMFRDYHATEPLSDNDDDEPNF